MRILHTADWHLGARLGVHDRTDELLAQAEHVLRLAQYHRAEVLLIVGDLFDRRTQPALTKRLADLLGPYVRDGPEVVVIPGNHDNRDHFRMMHALLTLENGQQGRIHIVQAWEVLRIGDVQFAAVPYPITELLAPFHVQAIGARERNITLSTAYADIVRTVTAQLDAALPAIFAMHITVAGVTTPSDYELTYDDDIRLGTEDLPLVDNLAYIALGHIHQQQCLPHRVPCWYSGSIERLNLGERHDQKGVLLVDVPSAGPADVVPVSLESTPFYDIEVQPAELDRLPERYTE